MGGRGEAFCLLVCDSLCFLQCLGSGTHSHSRQVEAVAGRWHPVSSSLVSVKALAIRIQSCTMLHLLCQPYSFMLASIRVPGLAPELSASLLSLHVHCPPSSSLGYFESISCHFFPAKQHIHSRAADCLAVATTAALALALARFLFLLLLSLCDQLSLHLLWGP